MNRDTQVLQGQNQNNVVPEMTRLQQNTVPGVNQDSCVQSWNNQFCAQGLNCPSGSNIDQIDDQYASIHNPSDGPIPKIVSTQSNCSSHTTEQECNAPIRNTSSTTSDQCQWKDGSCQNTY